MSDTLGSISDPTVEKLKVARGSPAVIKLRLAKLRSELDGEAIFVFEGDDDKIVYYQWIRRAKSGLSYASFPCGGKDQVLRLLDSVRSDQTGLSEGVFFFVDRDFDDLKGRAPGAELFVTNCYSVENYLVCDEVLDELLKIEFHCHASAEIRQQVRELFSNVFNQFLAVCREVNLRLYAARMHGLPMKPLTSKLGHIAAVSLGEVLPGSRPVAEVVAIEGELSEGEIQAAVATFDELDPPSRYRGKYNLMFFTRWLDELSDDAAAAGRGVFANLDNRSAIRRSEITLSSLASKSPLPEGLEQFLESASGK